MQNVDAYIGLLIQIPLVGIFVWFSLRLIDLFLKSLDLRDAQWKEFIKQEREASNIAITHMAQRFADEIRSLSKEISILNGLHKQ
jgi:hypothetical protein